MPTIEWDKEGARFFETGTDHGVLYVRDADGDYADGVAWNGLTAVTKSPTGAESNKQYADNLVYLNLVSAEEFEGTIECFTYPDEFMACNGEAEVSPGLVIGQQRRRGFGFSWRTMVGNDVDGQDHAYKIHLIWGATAGVAEAAYTTINDSPEALTFSYPITTQPTAVEGVTDTDGKPFKPTATMVLDSRRVPAEAMTAIEAILYGTEEDEPRLPLPGEVISIVETAS